MQFRTQGNRIQVLAYRGYDREKGRASVKLLGSMTKFGSDLSEGLAASLSEKESQELQSYIDNIRQSHDEVLATVHAQNLANHIAGVARSLSNSDLDIVVDQTYADAVYEAVDALTKALRKRKLTRLAKPKASVDQTG